jgi:C_GCAxxG_C_C family probable redox protein
MAERASPVELPVIRPMSAERPDATKLVDEVRRLTEEAFDAGLHCAEAVVSALAKAQGIDSDLVPKMATAFGSGMARTCGPCGALTGAVMGLSLSLGRSNERQSMLAAYAATQELIRTFEQEFGGRNCDELLGCDIGTPDGQDSFDRQALYKRCERYTVRAAEIAAALLTRTDDWPADAQIGGPKASTFP